MLLVLTMASMVLPAVKVLFESFGEMVGPSPAMPVKYGDNMEFIQILKLFGNLLAVLSVDSMISCGAKLPTAGVVSLAVESS
jgi:hypothetical protein